jgi:DNA-binding SARP family transcriptional activator
MQAVWPDRTAAQGTFDVAVHRLRKLLGNERALLLHEGRLSLNPAHCWLDIWAWEPLVRQIENPLSVRPQPSVARVLELYRGRFLANEPEYPWLVTTRARLHSQFLRVVAALGGILEHNGQWDEVLLLYRRGIEHDPLSEDIYRLLMRAYMRLGSPAEAINVYRRCSDVLSVVLGVKPSAETETLRASLSSA